MATWRDVRRIVSGFPDTTESSGRMGTATWHVHGKSFAWERPLRKADLAELGDAAPRGPILVVRTGDLGTKEAILASDRAFFTTSHFDGYAAVLVNLQAISATALRDVLTESWLVRAPKRTAETFVASRRAKRGKASLRRLANGDA